MSSTTRRRPDTAPSRAAGRYGRRAGALLTGPGRCRRSVERAAARSWSAAIGERPARLLRGGRGGGGAGGPEPRVGPLRRAGRWLRSGDGSGASFARFVLVGGTSNVVYVAALLLLDGAGVQVANAVGSIASTVLANELHRRLTFHVEARVGWLTAQLEGGGLALAGLVATSLALAGFGRLVGHPSALAHIAVVAVVTGVIGLVRFVALRAWFTHPEHPRPRSTDQT